jgi:tRNA (guanine37-N1)-methyltransferase
VIHLMRLDVVSIFPDYLAPLHLSLVGKAIEDGLIDLQVHDLRSWTHDKHHTVDDSPYGGGPGMVMKPEPWGEALDEILQPGGLLLIPTPAGVPLTQALAHELATKSQIVFACGRYEGIDSRVATHYRENFTVLEVSIGDYVLAGGEAAVLVIVEALARLVPGVLGNSESFADDSFALGEMEQLVEGPVYTRPPIWRELAVPEVLTSGDHAKIAAWRRSQAEAKTAQNRPDLTNNG